MIRIGISGWRYAPWRGVFYPRGLPQRRELEYASRQLSTIEVNGSFYSLQRPSSWRAWADEVPADFTFTAKGPRFLTHMRRLREVEAPLGTFLASGILALGHRLQALLWQLPPTMAFDPAQLGAFLDLLPRSLPDAAAYARRHHDASKLKHGVDLQAPDDLPLRHALEVRHASFDCAAFIDLARRHDVSVVVSDSAGQWPMIDAVTSDLVYVRLHGAQELYTSGYSPEALDHWATRIRTWDDAGHDVCVYFDNDVKVHAPFDAIALRERLDQGGERLSAGRERSPHRPA